MENYDGLRPVKALTRDSFVFSLNLNLSVSTADAPPRP